MDNPLKVIGTSSSTCGSCNSAGCGTCGPSPHTNKAPVAFNRREFGYTVLAASASALLTGCSQQKSVEQAAQPAPAAPALSPDLAVVQTSKGPVMTTLEEFYRPVQWELGTASAADLFRLMLAAHIEQHVAQLDAALPVA